MDIPEVALEVLARLPLKSIARFRLVSKEWKSLIDSDYFRRHHLSTNSSSSVSWSIVQTKPYKLTLEIVGHHGCKTWGLEKSLGSFVQFFARTTIRKLLVLACTDGLILVYTETTDPLPMYYIGNVLSQEWLHIPLPPTPSGQTLMKLRRDEHFSDSGLVTKMQSGIVVSYKIVWFLRNTSGTEVYFLIYSSDSWSWDIRKATFLQSNVLFSQINSLALNGILHWLSNLTTSFMAYDFYEDYVRNDYRIISFPDIDNDGELPLHRRTLTTSESSIMYVNEFNVNNNRTLRVWKLVKYIDGPDSWELCWEVNMAVLINPGIFYFPVVMHPLKSEIIYLWSRFTNSMILLNLRTRVFNIHRETAELNKCIDGSMLSFNNCTDYMEHISRHFNPSLPTNPNHLLFTQFVLPRWFHRLLRPQ